jgi:glycerol kinase
LGAPYWNPDARGIITGLSRGTNRNHIIRATLESLAFQTYDVLKAMAGDAATDMNTLKVDGGACANNFLMQFQADIAKTPVYRPKCIETTALGAAYLAGLSTGYWQSTAEIQELQQIERVFQPEMKEQEREKLLSGWEKAVNKLL